MRRDRRKDKRVERTHLLRIDADLFEQINSELEKCRPNLKSRNYFIIELIEIGLDQISREYKIHGTRSKLFLKGLGDSESYYSRVRDSRKGKKGSDKDDR